MTEPFRCASPDPAHESSAAGAGSGKLHVDSDWKAQAQAEKERLAAKETERERDRRGPDELPPADLKALVGMLASQALMGLGAYGDERGRAVVDLVGSRFAIDLLGVLEEKTKGNVTEDERKDIEAVLAELRNRYVQIATLVAQQIKAQGGTPPEGVLPHPSAAKAGAVPRAASGRPTLEMP